MYDSKTMRYWEPGTLSLMIYITEFVQREGEVSLSAGSAGLMRWLGWALYGSSNSGRLSTNKGVTVATLPELASN